MRNRVRKKRTTIYRVKEGATFAAYHLFSAFSIFVGILILTGFFILYQWKNVKILVYLEQNDKLKQEILILNAENSQLATTRNELLKKIPEIAEKKLKMVTQIEPVYKIYIDGNRLVKYEKKN